MKKNKILLIIISLIIIISTILIYSFINRSKSTNILENNTIETIKNYNYTLEKRDSAIYKDSYNELKKILSTDFIDFKKYAEILGKLYIIDLFTMNNKVTKYDVGGSEFVLPEYKETYELKVRDTLYKYLEDDTNKKRDQKLPEVETVTLIDINEEKLKVKEKSIDGYSLKYEWTYKEDLNYIKSAELKIIKKDNLLYIIEQK